jgi:hypothetical protein
MRSFWVEEEFPLVSALTGEHAALGECLIAGWTVEPLPVPAQGCGHAKLAPGNMLTTKVQREQVEAVRPFYRAVRFCGCIARRRGVEEKTIRQIMANGAAPGGSDSS